MTVLVISSHQRAGPLTGLFPSGFQRKIFYTFLIPIRATRTAYLIFLDLISLTIFREALKLRFPAGDGNFSLHHCVQVGCGAHPTSYPMDTSGSFPGDKEAGS
jgi:hypothetical protein